MRGGRGDKEESKVGCLDMRMYRQVRNLIEGQRRLHPGGKVLAPGGSSAEVHADQIMAGEAQPCGVPAPAEPAAMPRTSEGAISIGAKLGKPFEGQALPSHREGEPGTGPSHVKLQETALLPQVTILASSTGKEKGEYPGNKQMLMASP